MIRKTFGSLMSHKKGSICCLSEGVQAIRDL